MSKTKQFKNGNGFILIALVMMVILFISSSQTYEQQSQVGLLEKLLKNEPLKASLSKLSLNYAGETVSIYAIGYIKFVEFFIRKGAHFVSYFIIGGACFLGLNRRVKQVSLSAVVSWLAATGYAGLDEYRQMLTGGRTPLFEDVILDSLGAATAVLVCVLVIVVGRIRKGSG